MRLRILLVLAVAVVAPLVARAQNISTVAGGGPINLPTRSASIGAPASVLQDSLGNTYILDNPLNRVYKVDLSGNLSVYAGNGATGFAGDGGLAINAELNAPSGMCIDVNNNLFIADSDNGVVREVPAATVGGKTKGFMYTVAGVGGTIDYGGDGGPATSAFLTFPDGCAFDSTGNLYIADRFNHAIRMVAAATGNISTFAGTPAASTPPPAGYSPDGTVATSALLSNPFDVFVDSHDNVFIAEVGNNVIREVPFANVGLTMLAGHIYTVVGTQNVVGGYNLQNIPATTARLNGPKGLFVNANGDIFFADSVNQVIREVPATPSITPPMTAGFIYDVAGKQGTHGYSGDGRLATNASLTFPAKVFVDSTGDIFIADSNSNAIREVPAADTTTPFAMTAGDIYTVNGNGHLSFGGDGFPAVDAELNSPAGISIDTSGNLAIADLGSTVIRGVPAPIASSNILTLAGRPDFNGFVDGVPASTSVVNNAVGVFVDPSGNTFIADTGNCVVRKITGTTIATIAGTNPTVPDPTNPLITTPVCGFSAQGGVATSTILGAVNGVAVDGSGNVFFSDATNNVIWEVPKATAGSMTAGHAYIVVGTQQTIGSFGGEGGPATGAQLNSPTGIFIDIFGNLFIADTNNNLIREVPAENTTNPSPVIAGHIYTVAGAQGQPAGFSGEGQPAVGAQLNKPFTMVADHVGNIFIADTNNQIIRQVSAANVNGFTAGSIYTVGGDHTQPAGFSGDGAAATAAQLSNPKGLALDGAGDLLVADSVNNRVRSIANLANMAPVPVASFDQTSLTFATQLLNTPSAAQVVTLTNNGTSALTITGITITGANSGDFALAPASTCGGSLAAAANCTISVKFTPTAVGARAASVSIADSAFGSPQTVTLTGTGGLPTADLSPTTLAFANQLVTTPSPTQPFTLTNNGTVALAISGITITGTNNTDFGQTNTCGTSLAASAHCTITVTFTPTATGTRTAAVSIADNLAGSPQTVSLTGTGVAPAVGLSPSNSLTFVAQMLNTTSAAQTVTLTNTGTSALTITSITIVGTNPGDFPESDTCPKSPATLATSGTCAISVKFMPTANGARTASVSIADSATGSPQTVSLTGTGVAPAVGLSPSSGLTFTVQTVGITSAAQTVTLTNTGTSALTITGITTVGTNPGDFAESDNCPKSPSTIAVSGTCTISVKFTPTANGARTASVSIADNAAGSPQTVSLTGTGGTPAASFNSTTLTFSNQVVGTPSTAQTVTLTNTGTVPLVIAGIAVSGANSGDFALAPANTCGASLAVSANCTISVKFTPTAVGARTASVSIADSASGSPQTVSLTGTGVAPVAGLSANSLTFATPQTLNTTSAAQTVTLTNTGTSALTITGITLSGANSGDFAQTNTCGASLAISANCTISVKFTPTANGARTASVSIPDNASGSPQTVSLTGTGGTPAASFNSTTLTFSNQVVGTPSTAQTVTLTNTGTVPLSITGIAVSGANSGDFAETNTCGASLAASANCTISAVFTPGALGARSASVNVTDNAAGSPQAITLNGTGVAAPPTASLSSTSLAFADQFAGTPSAAQTVTLTNNSTSTLSITSIAVTGASNADYAQTNTCGASLAGNAKCTISVTFTPTASGARPASITVTDNAPTGTQTVSLTGNGFTISLAAASGGSMSQTVKAGQTATYSLQLSATGGAPTDQISVALGCSGAPSLATCSAPTAPIVVTPAAPSAFSITVATTGSAMLAPQSQTGPKMQPPAAIRILPLTVLALLLCIAAMLAWMQSPAGRLQTVRVALTACLVLLPVSATMFLTGCASSGGSTTPTPTPSTPAGTYTLTVTATVNGKSQTSQLTLVVQ